MAFSIGTQLGTHEITAVLGNNNQGDNSAVIGSLECPLREDSSSWPELASEDFGETFSRLWTGKSQQHHRVVQWPSLSNRRPAPFRHGRGDKRPDLLAAILLALEGPRAG